MSDKYRITVNGVYYDVDVVEMDGLAPANAVPAPTPAAAPVSAPLPQAAPAAQPAPAPVQAPAAATAAGEKVLAPLPGTILSVEVKAGDTVSSGRLLMILEAMKMENEVLAPCDGTVASVSVSVGSNVNTGDVLAVIG